jgi:NodT family efflux transporter outer membrane factor (OMF) lipoprotein
MLRVKKSIKYLALTYVILLTSCVVGPKYTRPQQSLPKSLALKTSPAQITHHQHLVLNKKIPKQWWRVFHSKELNQLIEISFKYNSDIKAAQAALLAAREEVYAFQGVFFPFVGFSAVPSKQQVAKILTSVLASNEYDYALFTGQVFVSYTPDVFGGNKRQEESLIAQMHYKQLQLEATYLTLASNVVNAAIQEASLRAQIRTTEHMIKSQRELFSLTKSRHRLGDASAYDVNIDEAALATSETSLPPLKKQLALQRNLLNALTGRFPDDPNTPKFEFSSIELPGELPISLPSALLEHRPDIRAAEEQMHAANARIGVSISNRLPNISLGFTNAGTTATNLGDLFNPETTFWGLAGVLTQPVYDAGTLLHKQKTAEAYYAQAAAQYRSTVIQAFQNVADTLNAIHQDNSAFEIAKLAEKAALTNLQISRKRWSVGDIDTCILLENVQNYRLAKLNVIQAQANRLSDSVALFQSLGGGWWIQQKTNMKTSQKISNTK